MGLVARGHAESQFPDQGSNPSPQIGWEILNTGPPGKSFQGSYFKGLFVCLFHWWLLQVFCSCSQSFPSWAKWGLLSSCCVWASHPSTFSCCSSRALECGLRSWGIWACGICPEQGLNLCSLNWQADFLTHWTIREVTPSLFLKYNSIEEKNDSLTLVISGWNQLISMWFACLCFYFLVSISYSKSDSSPYPFCTLGYVI